MKKFFGLFLVMAVVIVLLGASCEVTQEAINESTTANTNTAATADTNWTTATTKGTITDTPIAGTINEKEVTIASVQIDVWDDYYSWSFSSLAPDETCGLVMDDSAVNFSSVVLQKGTFSKTMTEEVEFDDYNAYYHYEQDDGTPMSVNVDWAATVVISEIDEDNNTVTGWAKFEFDDSKTEIEGSFEADLCE